MVVINNEKLEKYTTFKIGGIAEKFYIPQGVDELQQLLKCIEGEERYILSGGSNLLINDKKIFKNVIFSLDLRHFQRRQSPCRR